VNTRPEPDPPLPVLIPHHPSKAGDRLMRSKIALSALVIASLLGATAVASAQTQPAPGASTENKMAPGATTHKMKSSHMKTSKVKSGTTTGMSSSAHKSHKADKSNMSK
jgi:hypothetical protein